VFTTHFHSSELVYGNITFYFCAASQTCSSREMQTLDREQRKRLVFNWQSLSELFEPDRRLMSELHAKGCITARQREVLEKQQSSQQIKKLLEILSTKSLAQVDVFISCLPEAAQLFIRSLVNNTTGNFNILCLLSFIFRFS
jgi:hypothetical protein